MIHMNLLKPKLYLRQYTWKNGDKQWFFFRLGKGLIEIKRWFGTKYRFEYVLYVLWHYVEPERWAVGAIKKE